MIECRPVVVMGDDEGMMHAAVVVGHGIDGRVALNQDQTGPGGVAILLRRPSKKDAEGIAPRLSRAQ
jgi:hypothetical protein